MEGVDIALFTDIGGNMMGLFLLDMAAWEDEMPEAPEVPAG